MRKIKFRIWFTVLKKMVYTVGITELLFEDGNYYEYNGAKEPVVIEQLTGLYDKNGRGIYEGDIIVLKEDIKYRGIVVYNERMFEAIFNSAGLEDDVLNYIPRYIRIEGNIHENPELLENKCGGNSITSE